MASFSKQFLSAAAAGGGKAIAIGTTSGASATLIHSVPSTAGQFDEIWLYAMNTDTADRKLTIQFGSTATSDLIELTVPAELGLILVVPGLILGGIAGLEVRAFAASASVVNVSGYVNRIA